MKTTPPPGFRMVIPYGERRIRCDVRRSGQRVKRSVAIHVEPDGRVLVDAPQGAADAEIRLAVTKRLSWIHRRLTDIEKRLSLVQPREYVSGETVLYLGRRYRLKVVSSKSEAVTRLRGGYLEIPMTNRDPQAVRSEMEQWLRTRARDVLPQRLAKMAERLSWVRGSPPLSIRRMSRQWGSCSPTGRIALNLGLVRVPTECIDYVLLHELCHLRVHNHGRAFYRLLDMHLPDWRRIKSRLDEMADLVLCS